MSEPHECPLSEVIVGVDGDPTWTTSAPYPRPSCNGNGGQGTIRKPPHIKEGQMSEKKGPFDAAIGMLRGKGIRLFPPTEVQAAIRVLEAAGKIIEGKEWAVHEFDNLVRSAHDGYFPGDKEFHCRCHCRKLIKRFRALLESLPDEEQK